MECSQSAASPATSSESSGFDFRAFHARHRVGMIVACSQNGVIGDAGDLPWHLPRDLKHFMQSTRGCPVIMGRKTFETLKKPLPNRLNIVLSRSMNQDQSQGVRIACSIKDAIQIGEDSGLEGPIWIAGGGDIYQQSMGLVDLIVCTRVHAQVGGDTYFPEIDPKIWGRAYFEDFPANDRQSHAFTVEWWAKISD